MSSSFFIKGKQNPKFANKGKSAGALKRKVCYSNASKQPRLKLLLVYLTSILSIEDHEMIDLANFAAG